MDTRRRRVRFPSAVWTPIHLPIPLGWLDHDSASHSHAARPPFATYIPISDGCDATTRMQRCDTMRPMHTTMRRPIHAAMDTGNGCERTLALLCPPPPGPSFRVRRACGCWGSGSLSVASRRAVTSRRFYPLQLRSAPTCRVSLSRSVHLPEGTFQQPGSTYNSPRRAEMTSGSLCLLFVRAFPIGKDVVDLQVPGPWNSPVSIHITARFVGFAGFACPRARPTAWSGCLVREPGRIGYGWPWTADCPARRPSVKSNDALIRLSSSSLILIKHDQSNRRTNSQTITPNNPSNSQTNNHGESVRADPPIRSLGISLGRGGPTAGLHGCISSLGPPRWRRERTKRWRRGVRRELALFTLAQPLPLEDIASRVVTHRELIPHEHLCSSRTDGRHQRLQTTQLPA